MVIKIAHKIVVRSSPIHGLGVFAKEVICEGEIIEECPVISLSSEHRHALLDYSFKHNRDQYSDGI
jgi:SET domain-containing protein